MGIFDKIKEKAQDTIKTQTDTLKSKNVAGRNVGDLLKPLEDTINETVSNHKESKKELTFTVHVKKTLSKQSQPLTFRKDINGYYYISNKFDTNTPRYVFERISWNGSVFTEKTFTKGNIDTKGRVGSTLLGGAIAGPIGALAGANRKKKSKIETQSTTVTKENGSKAIIYLRSLDDNSIKEIQTHFTTALMANAESFFSKDSTPIKKDTSNNNSDVEDLRKFKELLDDNVITQEEFDAKKKELLDL
ncbi:SHOCT domain-containing protein [Enterococcus faecium]|uniref:SHOCT domain-containing protein n=1 Tax=Enterococcus faecium TaxID=1352 RepID=UPI000BF1FAE6|nr:SHOCT domain-containing protein [Enterococcus faecium]PEH49343.1 hypothetical protein CRM75_16335 [Enterococcus faecium]